MATIKEDFVSFELAKLLKEKGFFENTICSYADVGGITEKWYDDYRERVLRFDWEEGYLIEPPINPKDQYEIIGDTISAPTLQMTMKWLREVHKIYIDISPTYSEVEKTIHFIWQIFDSNYDAVGDCEIFYDKYETACEAAIKYCLDGLI